MDIKDRVEKVFWEYGTAIPLEKKVAIWQEIKHSEKRIKILIMGYKSLKEGILSNWKITSGI